MRKSVVFLLALGLLQMAGDVLRMPAIKGLAAATAASPAPKVFSAVRGLETYSTRFFLEWTDKTGHFQSVEITPERARGLRGPYNRRNVYGAVLAYGPIMQSDNTLRPMFNSVSHYALCGNAPLLHELGIDTADMQGAPRLRLETRPGTLAAGLPLTFEAPCK
jgi:hypothetical protein